MKHSTVAILLIVFTSIRCAGQGTGSLKITVTDVMDAIIAHAQVQMTGGKTINVVADEHGNALVEGLPPATYSVSAKFQGFVDGRISGIIVSAGMRQEVVLKLEQAPPKFSNIRSHETMEPHRFEKLLADFQEPDLCRGQIEELAHSYRFLWLAKFEHPILMRVDIGGDGNATVQTKTLSGAGGYELGSLETAKPRRLLYEEELTLFTTLADMGFWTLPARIENPYTANFLDPTTFVIEGVRDGKCHVVVRDASPLTEVFADYFLGGVGKLPPYSQDGNRDPEQEPNGGQPKL